MLSVQVKVQFQISDETSELDLKTDESYRLWIQTYNGNVIVVVTALTFQVSILTHAKSTIALYF